MVRGSSVVPNLIALAGFLGLVPSYASAQATVNPTRALFNASADHNATDGAGTPLVQSYDIGLYIVGASQPFQTVSIGKPTPDGTGTISVDMTAAFVGWPIVGTNYVADVAARGSGGVSRSTLSNTFSFTGASACSFTVSLATPSVPAASGSHTASVTTTSGCAWTGISNTTWITVTGASAATGNGTVTYSVTANTSASPRTGILTIAGQTVNVTQAGACIFTLSPTSQNVAAAGGAQTATVMTTTGCAWSAVSNNTSWITVTSGGSGTGNGTAGYTVAANPTTNPRTGTLTIAGQTVMVSQSGRSVGPPGAPTGVRVTGN
jgi:hypothetical protein